MPTGNEHAEVVRIGGLHPCQQIRQFGGLAELPLVFAIEPHHRLILRRHGPPLELDRIARQGGHLKGKARLVEVIHGQQGFHRVVAGREQGAVVGGQIALIGPDQQDLPATAQIGGGIVGPRQIRLARSELAQ